MKLLPPDTRQHRTLGAVFLITLMTATLVTTYFETQVVHGREYALRSEENRLRPVVIPAPRGSILDRNGAVVATSIPGYSILLLPASEAVVRSTLEDLAPFIGLAEGQIQQLLQRRAQRPNDLLPVASDATFSQVAMLEERLGSFPNLLVVDQPKRYYPAGAALGHLVGYVAEISPQELALPVYRDAGYRQGRWVGKAGLEKEYELRLSGKDGARFVEVDARGRVVNPHTIIGTLRPNRRFDHAHAEPRAAAVRALHLPRYYVRRRGCDGARHRRGARDVQQPRLRPERLRGRLRLALACAEFRQSQAAPRSGDLCHLPARLHLEARHRH